MKAIYLLVLIPLLSFATLELFFDFQYRTIDGEVKRTNQFVGKRTMVIVLPITQSENDTQSLQQLDSLSKQYDGQYTMVGVPSVEDGYTEDSLESLKTWYRSILDSQFVITAGMLTKKSSPSQHPLFHWLTNKNENTHFDEDVEGPGQMFFINEEGELYGVFSPKVGLNEQLLNRMAQ